MSKIQPIIFLAIMILLTLPISLIMRYLMNCTDSVAIQGTICAATMFFTLFVAMIVIRIVERYFE